MNTGKKGSDVEFAATSESTAPLVARSSVPKVTDYHLYRDDLRYDFFYSCAYCTMSEAEGHAIRFTIDHYEPRRARPELTLEYTNLMYSCDPCNVRKGDLCPPPEARADGYRFFRPDHDIFSEHFESIGIRLNAKSNVGSYTIEALDLNRQSLRRIRELRNRLANCDRMVAEGVMGLRKFHIDQLPQSIKGKANFAINRVGRLAEEVASQIDLLLREYACSHLIDHDPEEGSRAIERRSKLQELSSLYPGNWRTPKTTHS